MKTPRDSQHRRVPVKTTPLAKKPSGKRVVRGNKQPPVQKSPWSGCLATLGAIAILITTGGVIVGGIWLAILLMINPNAGVWLNQFLPEWTRIPIADASPPQTLAAIQDEVRQSGLIPGEPLPLDSELLLPLFTSAPNCQTDCEQIVELRVYQPSQLKGEQGLYQLVSQLPISGPEEYFVLSPSATAEVDNASLSRKLPLTKLTRFDDKAPAAGFWFNLSGQRVGGDTPMTYGQVIHYNPDQMHLSVMLQWTAPNEHQPYWQELTGTSTPELVIDRTVGLEPQFTVYQIQPRKFVPDPIYLEEISLALPALNTQAYRNALMLARSGLWSPAWQALQSQKKTNWSAVAQAQMDVIRLHAQVTQDQAKQAWATPSQQIFANLIDGRWADALLVFQAADAGAPVQEIATLLKTDTGGLWDRTQAALKVNPKDNNVKSWGALILAAQQGREKAIAYLKQLSSSPSSSPSPTLASTKETPEISQEMKELLDHLEAAFPETSLTISHASQILGSAQLVTNVNPKDWQQPEDLGWQQGTRQDPSQPPILQREAKQVWYQVQVSAFNDGQRWQQTPFTNLQLPTFAPIKQLWKYLGLDTDSQIQISVWTPEGQQETTIATVKAVSYQGGVIQLLAAGEALPAITPAASASPRKRPLAYTDSAFRWLEPDSILLSDLNKAQPQWVSAILPALGRELVKSGQLKSVALSSAAVMLREMGPWLVQLVDLTGNNEPEAVLTLYEDRSGALKKLDVKQPIKNSQLYKPRTLIFSDTGTLLYSEFSKNASASLTAMADLGDGGPAALVIHEKSNYSLKRWSPQGKRFE